MTVRKLSCPSCAAPIDVQAGQYQMKCPFCTSLLEVEAKQDEILLHLVERVTDTIRSTGQETQSAIHHGTYVTREELRKLQLTQDLSNVRMRLSNVQSEIRSLERSKQDRITRRQLSQLRQHENDLQLELDRLQAILNPRQASALEKHKSSRNSPPHEEAQERWLWLLFSFNGQASRLQFWRGIIVYIVLGVPILLLTAAPTAAQGADPGFFTSILGLASLWILLAISVKRFHDRNKSGWWVLVGLIPGIGPLWLLIELGFLQGD